MKHNIVFKEQGRFGGWPANYGIWSWGDEIVVGFAVGYHKDRGEHIHSIDHDRPTVGMQARSLDGGQTWQVGPVPAKTPGNKGMSADEHMNDELGIGNPDGLENAPQPCPGGIDFTHPDFALMVARNDLHEGARSWFYYSYDRCHTWEGPFSLPMFDQTGVAGRTDYQVRDANTCTLFLCGSKPNGREGRVFCYQTKDGGATWAFLSYIAEPEPPGYKMMPASVQLPDGRLLAALRCQGARDSEGQAPNWIELHESDDLGKTWQYINTPVSVTGGGGNPPAMIRLRDRRLCLVYGYRAEPYGIRGRLSEDDGQTWSDEVVLRDDAGNRDIGYPRIAQRSDGTVVAVYYYNDGPQENRYIAATLWKP